MLSQIYCIQVYCVIAFLLQTQFWMNQSHQCSHQKKSEPPILETFIDYDSSNQNNTNQPSTQIMENNKQIDVSKQDKNIKLFTKPSRNYMIGSYHQSKRRMAATEWQPIRLTSYWDKLDKDMASTPDKLRFVKESFSSVLRFFESSIQVQVEPVPGNLKLHRSCYRYWSTNPIRCVEYFDQNKMMCGHTEIPISHLANDTLWSETDSSKQIGSLPGGDGIPQTDTIIYIESDAKECGGNVVAYASACLRDQYGRPIAINVNVCPKFLPNGKPNTNDWLGWSNTLSHELLHGLVFSPQLWLHPTDSTKDFIATTSKIDSKTNKKIVTHIKSTGVVNFAKSYFNCNAAPITTSGVPLENAGGAGTVGAHWEEKQFMGETMSPATYADIEYLSGFTLSLMQDSKWYQIDDILGKSAPLRWGYHAGCSFFTDECLIKGSTPTVDAKYKPMWCAKTMEAGCTSDGYGKANCFAYDQTQQISDTEHRYDTDDPYWGGSLYSDYCPHYDGQDAKLCIDTDVLGSTTDNGISHYVNHADARCVQGNLKSGNSAATSQNGYCLKIACIDYDATSKRYNQMLIMSGENNNNGNPINVTCTYDEGLTGTTSKTVSGYGGSLTCPHLDYYCPQLKTTYCFHGHWNENSGKCVCDPGYSGQVCDQMDLNIEGWPDDDSGDSGSGAITSNHCTQYIIGLLLIFSVLIIMIC